MDIRKINRLVLFTTLLCSLVLIVSCSGQTPQATESSPSINRTVFVTQFVTQVVVTVPSTPPSLQGTAAPIITPANLGDWNPFSVPIYFPKTGCPASRLHIGDHAYIAYSGGLVGLYHLKSLAFDPTMKFPPVGTEVEIINGPYCDNEVIAWEVENEDEELRGFFPEGDGDSYWLLPMPPLTTPTP